MSAGGDAHDVDGDAFVDLTVRDRLGDQQAFLAEELRHPPEKGGRVAADADVAVDEEDRVPTSFGRERLEDGALQSLAAEPHRAGDGGFAHIDAEHPPAPGREFGDEPPRTAPHIEYSAFTVLQNIHVHRVGPGTPAFHLQRKQPAVGAT